MPYLFAKFTHRAYTVALTTELFDTLNRVESRFVNMTTLRERMNSLPRISRTEYDGRYGPAIHFGIDADLGDTPIEVAIDRAEDDVYETIEGHFELCVAFDRLLASDEVDPSTVKPLLVGPGFVMCDRGDLGVSLHFLSGGETGVKWFIDGAADQWREICAGADEDRRPYWAPLHTKRKVLACLPSDFDEEDNWVLWDYEEDEETYAPAP